ECDDLAAAEPERLAELIGLWWQEAERHGVLPLDDRGLELFGPKFRPHAPHPVDRRYVYRPPMSPISTQVAAAIGGRSFDLTARVTTTGDDEGVLYAVGNGTSGLSVFVQGRRLVLDYNAFGDHLVLVSDREVPPGDAELVVRVRRDSAPTGRAAVEIDGEPAGDVEIPLFMRVLSSSAASVGTDHGSAVSPRYTAPFTFTGRLHELVIQVSPERRPDLAEAAARTENARQ